MENWLKMQYVVPMTAGWMYRDDSNFDKHGYFLIQDASDRQSIALTYPAMTDGKDREAFT